VRDGTRAGGRLRNQAAPRADENGEPLYVIQLLVMGEDSADLIAVKVPFDSSQAEGAITH
jgi:hypothetical protein